MDKKLFWIVCITVAPILWLTSETFKTYNEQVTFRNIATQELNKVFIQDIKKTQFEFDHASDSLRLRIEVSDTFFESPLIEQFTLMEIAYLKLRYHLEYQEFPNAYYEKNIMIICENGEKSVLYENRDHHVVKSKTNGSLLINRQKWISKDDVLKDPTIMQAYLQDRTRNGNLEKDVMEYIENFSNILTKRQKYYRASEDDQLILDAVGDRFQLSVEEVKQIYKKHYLVYSHITA